MRTLRTKAIVLRRTNYGEADRIIQLLTPERKISVLARGVRKNGSKLAGALEPFSLSDVTIALGRGELGTITSARLEVFYRGILQEYSRLQLAYDIIKEINRIAEIIDEPECFTLLKTALESLHEPKISEKIIRIWFVLQLGRMLGQGVNVHSDANGAPLRQDQTYAFDRSEKVFVLLDQGQFDESAIKFLRVAEHNSPAVLARIAIDDELLTLLDSMIANP